MLCGHQGTEGRCEESGRIRFALWEDHWEAGSEETGWKVRKTMTFRWRTVADRESPGQGLD